MTRGTVTRWGTVSLAIAVALAGRGCSCDPTPPATQAASQPATAPTSVPATTQAVEKFVPKTLLDVVRANDANFPTTQPLKEPLEFAAAARLRIVEPVYLCRRGDLWITRDDAPPTNAVLADAGKAQTHVTRERVKFVYWRPVTQPWSAEIIADDSGGDVWVTRSHRLPLDRALVRDWATAGLWNTDSVNAIVVPTNLGVSILRLTNGAVDEQHVQLIDQPIAGATMRYALDTRGLIAWSVNPAGPSRVARFVDGKWTSLTPSPAWPQRLVHVVPFLDGTVLAIGLEGDAIQLRSVVVEPIPVDEANVLLLVKQLANPVPEKREEAQANLAAIGPGAWPVLRRLSPTQPAEARIRIRAILGNETTPTLSGISPEAGPGKVVCRLPDGGVVLNFVAGASAVMSNGVVQQFAPAFISVRPGEPALRLPDSLTNEIDKNNTSLVGWGDEWILEHDVDGPLRWMGNHTEPLLKQSEAGEFKKFVGIDAESRWVFKTLDASGPTLVIDPTLPDPRPRLPVWVIDVRNGAAGWNGDDYPVIKRGGAFILKNGAWSAIPAEKVDADFKTALAPPASMPADAPLLTDADGNVYRDGLETLQVTRKSGETITWPLPATAVGSGVLNGRAILIEADGKLFLANMPGRLLRIGVDWKRAEPLKLEATFARQIPATDVRRIWKDPLGRIVFASRGSMLSVCFPAGRIESQMANMIPAGALREALADEGGSEALVPAKP